MTFPANVNALSSDFAGLNLTLTLRDVQVGSVEVRLRFYLEKNGVSLVTTDDPLFAPISIASGVPTTLTGPDLAPYFLPHAFDIIEGLDREDFLRSGGDLPEGLYTLCVEVLHFLRFDEAPLSAKSCALSSMDLLDPPLITTPYSDQVFDVTDTLIQQPLEINWLMNFSTMTFPVDYELYIYPYDETAAAFGLGNDFFQRAPLFETLIQGSTQSLNQFVFGVGGEVEQMQAGQKYVLRIRASSPSETVYFRNQGYSDPILFQYGRSDEEIEVVDCFPPVIMEAHAISDSEYEILWAALDGSKGYSVVITDENGKRIDSIRTTRSHITLKDLDSKVDYEGRVWSHCISGGYLASAPFYITTSHNLPTIVYNCGLPTEPLMSQNTTPVTALVVGDTIVAGDFKVKLSQVSGSGDYYTGTGEVVWNFPIPNLLTHDDPIAVNIDFEHIKVNSDYFMYDGIMQVQGVGVNLVPVALSDYLREFGELDFVPMEFKKGPQLLDVDFTIGAISEEDGVLIISGTDENGNPTQKGINWNGEDIEIFDRDGKAWTVDQDGKVTQAGELAEGGRPTINNTEGVDAVGAPEVIEVGVVFERGAGYYAFDDVSANASEFEKGLYPSISVAETDAQYHYAYKAVKNGQPDVVTAQIVDPGINTDSLIFKTQSGRKIPHEMAGATEITLNIEGFFTSATETILACLKRGDQKQHLVGAFKLMHIAGQDVQVVLVPLGSASVPGDIGGRLSDIFGPLAIDIETTTRIPLRLPPNLLGTDGAIDTDGTGTFANYSAEQQAINDHVRTTLGPAYNSEAYYLIFTDAASSTDLAGYMPLQRQFGYLFSKGNEESKSTASVTAAHELGHGIWGLEHPFTRWSVPVGTTDWLMDYSDGVALPHIHWSQMYDPEFRLYTFQKDEEGEQIVLGKPFIYASYVYYAQEEGVNQPYGCLTPSGEKYILPSNAIASFFPDQNGRWAQGCLAGFQIDRKNYYGWWSRDEQTFLGYATGEIDEEKQIEKSGDYFASIAEQKVQVYAGLVKEDCEQVILQAPDTKAPLFTNHKKLLPQLDLSDFEEISSETIPQTNCGCYHGECQELLIKYKNHLYLTSDNILKRIICANPCLLNDLERFDFFEYPTSEWVENLNNICAGLLAFGFSPVAVFVSGQASQGILVPILEGIASLTASQIATRFSVGMLLDVMIQNAVHYYFPENGDAISWEEANDKVDWIAASLSGAEALILLESKYAEAGISAAISCFVDGALSEGKVKEEFDLVQCSQGAFSALFLHGLLSASPAALRYLRSLPPDRLVNGLIRFFNSTPPGVHAAGFSPDGATLWRGLKNILPDPLDSDHIKTLFNISDDDLARDLLSALDDPVAKSDFLESGLFLRIVNQDFTESVREQFVRDLMDSKGIRDLVMANEGAVRAWGVIDGHPQLRVDVDVLESLSKALDDDYLKTLNLDQVITNKWTQHGFGCPTCTNGGKPWINELIDQLDHFKQFKDIDGYQTVLNQLLDQGQTQAIWISLGDEVYKAEEFISD